MLSLPIRTFPIVRSAVGENTEKATALRSLRKSVRAQYLIAGNGEMDWTAYSLLLLEFLLAKAVIFVGTIKQRCFMLAFIWKHDQYRQPPLKIICHAVQGHNKILTNCSILFDLHIRLYPEDPLAIGLQLKEMAFNYAM